MNCSRRNWLVWLTGLAAAASAEETHRLPSKAYRFEDLAVRESGGNVFRSILEGQTHDGFSIELHETDLAPGAMPHPPHHHVHEEVFLIRGGNVEVTIAGGASRLGPGSAAFVGSNEEHSIRNVGTEPARYFVVALGGSS